MYVLSQVISILLNQVHCNPKQHRTQPGTRHCTYMQFMSNSVHSGDISRPDTRCQAILDTIGTFYHLRWGRRQGTTHAHTATVHRCVHTHTLYTYTHAHTHTQTHIRARARARAHTHTRRAIFVGSSHAVSTVEAHIHVNTRTARGRQEDGKRTAVMQMGLLCQEGNMCNPS